MRQPKYIFCTGGVVSSVGKGITVAAIVGAAVLARAPALHQPALRKTSN